MGILQRLFGKKNSEVTEHASTKSAQPESEWEKLEAVIASAIAAGESNDSQWAVKEIYQKRNS